MEITVQELATLVGGQFASGAGGGLGSSITGAASIEEAGPGDVTFYGGNVRYLSALKACRATAVLAPEDFAEDVPPAAIAVANPTLAFSKVLARLAPEPIAFTPGIHPAAIVADSAKVAPDASIQPHAVVEPGASIGAGTVIGAGSYIGHEAVVGEGCQLSQRVIVGARCRLGNRLIIHSGVVIGGDGFGFEMADGRHVKIPQTGIVQIDDDVEIGANTTIDRARFGRTWIGEGTKIDNLVQIAHNVAVGKHCIICALTGISGSTRLGDYVVMGGQVGTVGHIEIGAGARIGARSGVAKSLPPKAVVWGCPARPIAEFTRSLARVNRLGDFFETVKRIEQELDELKKSSSGER